MAISSRITEITLPTGGRVAILPTSAKDVVTIRGSIIGGPAAFGYDADAAAEMAAALLDAGAGKLSRDAFRSSLAERGAGLSFGLSGTRLTFSASCFPEDLPFVIARIADALLAPHLPAADYATEKTRSFSMLEEESTDTDAQSNIALARLIFPASHPYYAVTTADTRKQLQVGVVADAKALARQYGAKHLALAIVGDVSAKQAREAAEKAFGKAREGHDRPVFSVRTGRTRPDVQRANIHIADKANVDVVIGSSVGFNADDPRYIPSALLMHMLGAGFNAHLFQTVRERDSLTYHISGRLQGLKDKLDGAMHFHGIFAPQLLMRGTETTLREIAIFFKNGVTEQSVSEAKEEIASAYAVSLGDTQGLALRLMQFMEDDRPLSRIDEYPNLIRAVTLEEAQAAAAYLASLPLSVATAGSI